MQNNRLPENPKLSSFKMIGATLLNDMPSRYWALLLNKNKNPASSLPVARIHLIGLFLKTLTLAMFFTVSILGQREIVVLSVLAFGAILSIMLEMKERKELRSRTLAILKEDYTDEDLAKHTLYELTEKISRQLRIPSLVDLIVKSNIYARIVLVLYVFLCLLFTTKAFSFWLFLLWGWIIILLTKVVVFESYITFNNVKAKIIKPNRDVVNIKNK